MHKRFPSPERTHGTVELTERIDSFQLGKDDCLCTDHNFYDYFLFQDSEGDGLEIVDDTGETRATIMISELNIRSHQQFFICPHCGKRTRYLYVTGIYEFKCRECSHLNYKSQQEFRYYLDYYREGLEFAREVFDWEPPSSICPMDWDVCPLPKKPRYMHESEYRKLIKKYQWYIKRYREGVNAELAEIMNRRRYKK